jgi:hypothetical protein
VGAPSSSLAVPPNLGRHRFDYVTVDSEQSAQPIPLELGLFLS